MKTATKLWIGAAVVCAVAGIVVFRLASGTPDVNRGGPDDRLAVSVIPLTGTSGEFGGYNREASELFVDDYNAAHPGGPRLRHAFEDSGSTGKGGVTALQALLAGPVRPFAVQVQTSAVADAVGQTAAAHRLLMVSVGATESVKKSNPHAFRNYPVPAKVARRTVEAYFTGPDADRVGLMWMSDQFGRTMADVLRAELAARGRSPVGDVSFDPGSTDSRGAITKLLESKPQAVYVAGIGVALGRVVSQLRQLGFTGQIVGGSEFAHADVLKTAGPAAEGVRYIDLGFDPTSPDEPTRGFVDRYTAKFGHAPTVTSAVLYDGWAVLLAAVDRAKGTDPDAVTAAMLDGTPHPGLCGVLRVTADRDYDYPTVAKVIRDGRPTFLDR